MLLSTPPSEAAPAHSRMLEQCESGVAKACFDYGLYLQNQRDPQAKKNGGIYVRRACTMAYQPACRQASKPILPGPGTTARGTGDEDMLKELSDHRKQVQKTVGDIQTKYGSTGDPSAQSPQGPRVSVWEAAGFRATPFMVKLLGAKNFAYTGSEQPEDGSKD
jgi:hypothetical protein